MSRKSFQKVTLSVELTLPPGVNTKTGVEIFKKQLRSTPPWPSYSAEQTIIKILKRETIYTS